MQHIQDWIDAQWDLGAALNLSPACSLKDDLGFDDIARVELFHYLDEKYDKKSTEALVFHTAQTVKDIIEFYTEDTIEPKIAFLFPGQGAQVVGMAKEFIEHPQAMALFEKASKILEYDLLEMCLNGPKEKLDMTAVSQVAIYVCSVASLEVLKEDTPELYDKCTCMAGLSLGEYTALVASGAMDFESGLALVKARAEAMQLAADAKQGAMVSVLGVDEKTVNLLIADTLASTQGVMKIANYLCPGNIVVSGDAASCDLVLQTATKPPKLAVSGAFHSEFMLQARDGLAKALNQVSFALSRQQVMCNLTGGEYNFTSDQGIHFEVLHNLTNQLTSPVRWEQSILVLLRQGYNHFYEVGPGTVLVGLMRHILNANPQFENVHVEKI